MAAVTTATVLQHYEFKLSEAEVRLVGVALQKLPMEQVYATVMNIERQVQEQNFQLQQADVQNKVTTANAEALTLAAANPTGEPPLVTFEEPVPAEPALEPTPEPPASEAPAEPAPEPQPEAAD